MGRERVIIYNQREIGGIRHAAQRAAAVRQLLCSQIRPGMTSLQIDQIAAELIQQSNGDKCAFYQYRGFPGSICISINDEVVHGIGRAERTIQPGDLVSIDVGVRSNGFIGDTAWTVYVGGVAPDPEYVRLLDAGKACLDAGIAAAISGNYVNDIGNAIEHVVITAGFAVVRDFVGHGCGRLLHEPPEVPNFACNKRGPRLRPGMVLAIEPMVNLGSHRVFIGDDGWTVHTTDGKVSVHFEHMVLITEDEPEILTWAKTQLE